MKLNFEILEIVHTMINVVKSKPPILEKTLVWFVQERCGIYLFIVELITAFSTNLFATTRNYYVRYYGNFLSAVLDRVMDG